MHPLLASFPISIEIPVQWGDMDAYGHVNNTVFFRWFESARMAYFEQCGFTRTHVENLVGAILHSTSCRFRMPLFYPDTVEVGARVIKMLPDRFEMEYHVVSQATGKLAGEGTGTVVAFDYKEGKKTAVPAVVAKSVTDLENSIHTKPRES